MLRMLSILLLVMGSSLVAAQDQPAVVIIETTIVGGKQAPKVLSIVPWRLQQPMILPAQPAALKHQSQKALDPKEFQETLRLLKQTNSP